MSIIDLQGIHSELGKIGISKREAQQANDKYDEIVRNTPIPPNVPSLPRERADLVARWTIDFCMGIEVLPHTREVLGRGGQDVDGDVPNPKSGTADATGILSRAPELDSVKSLTVRMFTSVQEYDARHGPPGPDELIPLPTYWKDHFDFLGLTNHFLASLATSRINFTPEWTAFPNDYKFPTGFPQNDAEKDLCYQVTYLLAAFTTRASFSSEHMTRALRETLPQWRLPSGSSVQWQDVDQRSKYLASVEACLTNVNSRIHDMLSNAIMPFCQFEVTQFLLNVRQHVAADPAIFETYWNFQLWRIIYETYRAFETFIANMRFVIVILKGRLEKVNFEQENSMRLAAEAVAQQDDNISGLASRPLFWVIAGPSMGTLLSLRVYLDRGPGQHPGPELDGPFKGMPAYGKTVFEVRGF